MPRTFHPGWHPDYAQRARDRLAAQGRPVQQARPQVAAALPPAFSLAKYRRWPQDQDETGTCFGNGPTQAAQIDLVFGDPARAFQISRRWVVYESLKRDNALRGPMGGSVVSSCQAICEGNGGVGAAHEALWPYLPPSLPPHGDPRREQALDRWMKTAPPQNVVADAAQTFFTQFGEVARDAWKACIFSGRAVCLGTWWPNGWDSAIDSRGRTTGVGPGGYGHAYILIGWIDDWDGHTYWQDENSHGGIYPPLPADVAARVPGYVPAQRDKTFDFWARDDHMQAVIAKGNAEMCSIAGPEGWTARSPGIDPDAIMPFYV